MFLLSPPTYSRCFGSVFLCFLLLSLILSNLIVFYPTLSHTIESGILTYLHERIRRNTDFLSNSRKKICNSQSNILFFPFGYGTINAQYSSEAALSEGYFCSIHKNENKEVMSNGR